MTEKQMQNTTDMTAYGHSGGHTLVCLSSSPSNSKIIRAAAKMAASYGGSFTALYVKTSHSDSMSEENKKRLQSHIQLAESLGADIATVYGNDISYQIAEFARLSGVTEIVIGRSATGRRHFWSEPSLTERLTEIAPNMDIHIIPDLNADVHYREKRFPKVADIIPKPLDVLITAALLAVSTLIGIGMRAAGITPVNTITIYILGVLLTSLLTQGYTCGVLSSILSVSLFNYFLIEPLFTFRIYDASYSVTFAIMLVISIITGTLTSRLKDRAKLSAQASFRTKILFDTSKLLQKEREDQEIIRITASQLGILLERAVIACPEQDGKLMEGIVFAGDGSAPSGTGVLLSEALEKNLPGAAAYASDADQRAAELALERRERTGVTTEIRNDASCLYMPIRMNEKVYGVIGIDISGHPLDSFENSIIQSILGECSLAIENSRTQKAKEQADLLAKNEQLRANLLRSISHDLRTPLTSISGHASNLLTEKWLDDDTRHRMYLDIYDDSQWLIDLVENLLSVTRIEEGRMKINLSLQLVDEVVDEAMRHINRKSSEHRIVVEYEEDMLLARMDPRLIMQVIINLVNNAIKYTEEGSEIRITAGRKEKEIFIRIADTGNGISDADKEHVFEMFYTGNMTVADSRRSLGLGLALCRSIVNAHGGAIALSDNEPHGTVFTVTLPSDEVTLHE